MRWGGWQVGESQVVQQREGEGEEAHCGGGTVGVVLPTILTGCATTGALCTSECGAFNVANALDIIGCLAASDAHDYSARRPCLEGHGVSMFSMFVGGTEPACSRVPAKLGGAMSSELLPAPGSPCRRLRSTAL